jgi:hypothetical protein
MEKERKLMCDCGGTFSEKIAKLKVNTEALVCDRCGYVTMNWEQAEKYAQRLDMNDIVSGKRKIIKIGNSLGFTLPERLRKMGVKAGGSVKLEATGPKSFSVELL